MVVCLERGADLHMAQLMALPLTVSCFSKIQIGFTFLVPALPGSPGQRAVKRVCVCLTVSVTVYIFLATEVVTANKLHGLSHCCVIMSVEWKSEFWATECTQVLCSALSSRLQMLSAGNPCLVIYLLPQFHPSFQWIVLIISHLRNNENIHHMTIWLWCLVLVIT